MPLPNKTSTNFSSLSDFWILRVDALGNKLWEATYGGTLYEQLKGLQVAPDGGFIACGISYSDASGVKSSPHYGNGDGWVVRLDSNGHKLWDRSFGGTNEDSIRTIVGTSDGGFLLGGYSASPPGGNKSSTNYGGRDFWVLRLDADGNKLWEQTYGGSGNDELLDMEVLSDGTILLGGGSTSPANGSKTSPNYGNTDFWLVAINTNGQQLWDMSFGGNSGDRLLACRQTSDGGFLLGGISRSPVSGNKTVTNFLNSPTSDLWVIRLDAFRQTVWQQTFATTEIGDHGLLDLQLTPEGGFIVLGVALSSLSGSKSCLGFGSGDYWLIRCDAAGNKLWDMCLGGSGAENAGVPYDSTMSVQLHLTRDGGFIFNGKSHSPADGNKTSPNFGDEDYWVVKLGPDDLTRPPRLRWERCCFEDIGLQWRLLLAGTSNVSYRTEVSTNLVNWTAFKTNQVAGSEVEVFHSPLSFLPQRFFRARTVP